MGIHAEEQVHLHNNTIVDKFATRVMQACLSISIFGRLLYYMQIIDAIAPLINIIFLIFADIKWFFVIFVIIIFAFSSSFQLLYRNQLDYDHIHEDDATYPDYTTTLDAFIHVFRVALGDFQNDMYSVGKGSSRGILTFFWYMATIML